MSKYKQLSNLYGLEKVLKVVELFYELLLLSEKGKPIKNNYYFDIDNYLGIDEVKKSLSFRNLFSKQKHYLPYNMAFFYFVSDFDSLEESESQFELEQLKQFLGYILSECIIEIHRGEGPELHFNISSWSPELALTSEENEFLEDVHYYFILAMKQASEDLHKNPRGLGCIREYINIFRKLLSKDKHLIRKESLQTI